jgi:hypothetical protein
MHELEKCMLDMYRQSNLPTVSLDSLDEESIGDGQMIITKNFIDAVSKALKK